MTVIEVVVCYSMLLTLPFASSECTPENSLNCSAKYKIGTIDVAGQNKRLRELIEQKEELGRMYKLSYLQTYLVYIEHELEEIPEFFDAREKWPMCESISRIKHQGVCGTCWAFAGGMIASDRVCISSEGRTKIDISQEHLITCCEDCFSDSFEDRCSTGSNTPSAYAYMIENGVVDDECVPYDSLTLEKKIEQKCKLSCKNETIPYNKVDLNMSVILGGLVESGDSTLEDIQIEIMKHGPVGSTLVDLPGVIATTYTDQVYTDPVDYSGQRGSAHSIRIIGWGVENGVPYWLCANSWGENWGKLKGFFKIKRGTNEFGIESVFLAIGPKRRLIEEDDNRRLKEEDDDNDRTAEPREPGYSSAMSFTKSSHVFVIITIVVIAYMSYCI